MTDPTQPILGVERLSKTFEGRRRGLGAATAPVRAVRDVSFELTAGGALGIVGESGSGKTTVARILMGLERRTQGTVRIAGSDLGERPAAEARLTRSRLLQMVFQDPFTSLDPHSRVGDGIDEIQRVHFTRSRPERIRRTTELLESVGLTQSHATATPGTLSGGQRQRVAIARALASEPKILVLDEAVSALDVSIQAQILNLLAELRARLNLTYILISHDLAVVRQLADEVLVMYRGTIVEQGPIEVVMTAPQHPYTKRLIASIPRPGMHLASQGDESLAPAEQAGCVFRGRCEHRHDRCVEEPELRRLGGGHAARCFLVDSRDGTVDG